MTIYYLPITTTELLIYNLHVLIIAKIHSDLMSVLSIISIKDADI